MHEYTVLAWDPFKVLARGAILCDKPRIGRSHSSGPPPADASSAINNNRRLGYRCEATMGEEVCSQHATAICCGAHTAASAVRIPNTKIGRLTEVHPAALPLWIIRRTEHREYAIWAMLVDPLGARQVIAPATCCVSKQLTNAVRSLVIVNIDQFLKFGCKSVWESWARAEALHRSNAERGKYGPCQMSHDGCRIS